MSAAGTVRHLPFPAMTALSLRQAPASGGHGSAGRVRISAHRGAVSGRGGVADLEAFDRASRSGVDLVEFDVRTTRDGELVALHDSCLADGRRVRSLTLAELRAAIGVVVPTVEEVLRSVAPYAIAHIDLKEVGIERRVAELAIELVGLEGFFLTTLEDASVAVLKLAFPHVRVGLSLGRDVRGMSPLDALWVRASEIFPGRRIRRCGPDFVAAAYLLARLRLLRFCTRRGVEIWVWTVDRERAIRRVLRDRRVAVLVTNRAARTVALRGHR